MSLSEGNLWSRPEFEVNCWIEKQAYKTSTTGRTKSFPLSSDNSSGCPSTSSLGLTNRPVVLAVGVKTTLKVPSGFLTTLPKHVSERNEPRLTLSNWSTSSVIDEDYHNNFWVH